MLEDINEQHFRELASQLSCPNGELGLKTAENMAVNNSRMIQTAIAALALEDGDKVLEIGPGGGSHVPLLMSCAEDLSYHGVDISKLMVEEATRFNKNHASADKVIFTWSDGERLSFPDASFDKIFTVNTLYFWKDAAAYAREIARVLKPNGLFCVCFAPKHFMVKLPFTHYIFNLYTLAEGEHLLKEAFDTVNSVAHTETVKVSPEEQIEREFIVTVAQKY